MLSLFGYIVAALVIIYWYYARRPRHFRALEASASSRERLEKIQRGYTRSNRVALLFRIQLAVAVGLLVYSAVRLVIGDY